MRDLHELDTMRIDMSHVYGSLGDAGNGVFEVRSKIDGTMLKVIASNGGGWDHVSVSHRRRVPNWYEMEQVKALFFEENETCMQLHVPAADHINNHANCLHLWRPHDIEIPRPPSYMVGAGVGPRPIPSVMMAAFQVMANEPVQGTAIACPVQRPVGREEEWDGADV
jgi:hypothetical protein